MKMIPVTSSNVEAIGYDPETKTLRVKFKSGGAYDYAGVDQDKHSALMNAGSYGRHLHDHFKGKHSHSKVGGDG